VAKLQMGGHAPWTSLAPPLATSSLRSLAWWRNFTAKKSN